MVLYYHRYITNDKFKKLSDLVTEHINLGYNSYDKIRNSNWHNIGITNVDIKYPFSVVTKINYRILSIIKV